MNVTIELKPETERRLAERARRRNLRIETYLEVFLETSLEDENETLVQEKDAQFQETAADEDWSAKFHRLLNNRVDKGEPFLSDQATRRENIYEDRL